MALFKGDVRQRISRKSMFNLIAPIYFMLLSTDPNECLNSYSRTGEIVAQSIPKTELKKEQSPVIPTSQISKVQETDNTTIPVVLPSNAKVQLKTGSTLEKAKVRGFNAKQQTLTLGEKPIPLAQIEKVTFDDKALAYQSDGKIVIRGEDTAKAVQRTWSVLLSAFELKDQRLGQAQINLAGIIKPLELKSIRTVAVKSVYVVNEIQFQPTGKMTITVTPADR
jgi:hypothetical protein